MFISLFCICASSFDQRSILSIWSIGHILVLYASNPDGLQRMCQAVLFFHCPQVACFHNPLLQQPLTSMGFRIQTLDFDSPVLGSLYGQILEIWGVLVYSANSSTTYIWRGLCTVNSWSVIFLIYCILLISATGTHTKFKY